MSDVVVFNARAMFSIVDSVGLKEMERKEQRREGAGAVDGIVVSFLIEFGWCGFGACWLRHVLLLADYT